MIRLAANARLILLPVCSYCRQVAPKCGCGTPNLHKRKAK